MTKFAGFRSVSSSSSQSLQNILMSPDFIHALKIERASKLLPSLQGEGIHVSSSILHTNESDPRSYEIT